MLADTRRFARNHAETQHGSPVDSFGVAIRQEPDYRAAYIRSYGEYRPQTLDPLYARIRSWLACIVPNPTIIGISRSYPSITSPRRCQYDMCGVLPAGVDPESDMSVQTLRGGLTAVYRCELDEVDLFFCCQTVFNWLTNEWLPGSGFKPDDRPVYKIFIEDPSQNRRGNYLFEFCAPVQPMTEPIRVV